MLRSGWIRITFIIVILVVILSHSTANNEQFEAAMELYKQGDYLASIAICEELLSSSASMLDVLQLYSVAELALGHLTRAEELMRSVIQLAPMESVYYSNLGEILRLAGHYPEALATLEQGLALDPTSPSALLNMGLTFQDLGQVEEAMNCFHRLLHQETMHHASRLFLGMCETPACVHMTHKFNLGRFSQSVL